MPVSGSLRPSLRIRLRLSLPSTILSLSLAGRVSSQDEASQAGFPPQGPAYNLLFAICDQRRASAGWPTTCD